MSVQTTAQRLCATHKCLHSEPMHNGGPTGYSCVFCDCSGFTEPKPLSSVPPPPEEPQDVSTEGHSPDIIHAINTLKRYDWTRRAAWAEVMEAVKAVKPDE